MGGRLQAALGDRVDLLVVGGGIYGACLAHGAARRGVSVALIERADFAGGTSGQSLRVLHGGLRYLQHLDWRRMRESIRARRRWMRRFPDLVAPQAFSLPTFGHGVRGREAFRVGLALNDLASWDRNAGLGERQQLPRGRVLPRRAAEELYSGFAVEGFNGAALWYDALSVDSERMLIRLLVDAARADARVANYAEARAVRTANGKVAAVEILDRADGSTHELAADRVLATAGPWAADLMERSGLPQPDRAHFSLAMNVVVRDLRVSHGLGVPVPRLGRDGDAIVDSGSNSLFFVPWGKHTLVGTRHFSVEPGAATPEVVQACVGRFMEEIQGLTRGAETLSDDRVVAVLAGWLPEAGAVRPDRDPVIAKHPRVADHGAAGAAGLTTVQGVKWTTADIVAESVLDTLYPDRPRERHAEDPDRDEAPAAAGPLTRERVAHQVQHEWVRELSDIVQRRNPLWLDEPDDAMLETLAGWAGEELGWDEQQRAAQVARTRAALNERRGPRKREDGDPI